MDLEKLPEDPLQRLATYQRERALEEALNKEIARVADALVVPERERTKAQESAIAYSRFGTAARSCH